jgi:hypothetical protein
LLHYWGSIKEAASPGHQAYRELEGPCCASVSSPESHCDPQCWILLKDHQCQAHMKVSLQ